MSIRRIWFLAICLAVSLLASAAAVRSEEANKPLSLHPDNGHYFQFRGKPTIIITSGEHYGAVINLDFDYVKYLDELQAHGLNNTRTWAGAYCEDDKAFNIAHNTLAPAKGRFICPWARSDRPGYPNGGNKFDLNKWDEAYFNRLKDFVTQASKRGVIVEMNLFCPFYEDSMWQLSPQNAANNINGVGRCPRTDVYTLDKNDGLLKVQEEMTRKIVRELNGFDNVYYEVCNEPYFGGVTIEWQHHIVDTIVAAEKDLPNKHLVSMNIANGSKKIENPHASVSIFNFHYASPPTTVGQNYGLGKVIGDNETGFKGTKDDHYRMEAWEFILAGGGLYNNLDYSFTVGHEDGTFQYPDKQPGGGSLALRQQLAVLKDFIGQFDFLRMKPARSAVKNELAKEDHLQLLVEEGMQYAGYCKLRTSVPLKIAMPTGKYLVTWLNAVNGKQVVSFTLNHSEGDATVQMPAQTGEYAVVIRRDR